MENSYNKILTPPPSQSLEKLSLPSMYTLEKSDLLSSADSSSTSSFNMSWISIIAIILLLAFLGFNIFIYLAKGTQGFVDIITYFAKMLDIDVSNMVYVSAGATKNVASTVQNVVEQPPQNLTQAIQKPQEQQPLQKEEQYYADDAQSSIQTGSGKAGWCYIGEDRGFRTCAKINETDKCMSGDIFPSHEICVNPNLRT